MIVLQLAHLLAQATVLQTESSRLTPRAGKLLCEDGKDRAQALQPLEQLVPIGVRRLEVWNGAG